MNQRRDLIAATGTFLCVAAFLWWLVGNRLVFRNDEGIYLEGARQMLSGTMPYRDFFALTSPGVYWNLAAVFSIFGVSIPGGRSLLVFDLALIAGCIFWIGLKLHSRLAGLWMAWFWVAILAVHSGSLAVNHRWDSAALSTFAATMMLVANENQRRWPLIAAGAAAAYAAWVTPTVLLVALPMLVWAFLEQKWKGVLAFCGGGALVSAAAVGALAVTGLLIPLIEHLFWTTSQYAGANRVPYGGLNGGYQVIFAGANGLELLMRGYVMLYIIAPALIPVVAVIAFAAARGVWSRRMLLLLLCGLAAVLATAPRMDVEHLAFAIPILLPIATCAVAEIIPRRAIAPFFALVSLGACALLWTAIGGRPGLASLESRVGQVVGERAEINLVRDLEAGVQHGESFFAFPYLPAAYFVTQGANPTRFSFLQPGMMSEADENLALTSLQKGQPSKILYIDVPPEELLRFFPSSDPSHLRMEHIESWIKANYVPIEAFSKSNPGFSLLERRQ